MKFKRGDTFLFTGALPATFPAGTWEALCDAADETGQKFPIEVDLSDFPLLTLRAEPAQTKLWTLGTMKADIQFTDTAAAPPFVMSSQDFEFEVIEDRTVT